MFFSLSLREGWASLWKDEFMNIFLFIIQNSFVTIVVGVELKGERNEKWNVYGIKQCVLPHYLPLYPFCNIVNRTKDWLLSVPCLIMRTNSFVSRDLFDVAVTFPCHVDREYFSRTRNLLYMRNRQKSHHYHCCIHARQCMQFCTRNFLAAHGLVSSEK